MGLAIDGDDSRDETPTALLPGSGGGRYRVLVIDDNVRSAESLATIVKLWGHETRVAHTGPEAIEVALAFRPEITLLDIGLPGMDGFAVARHLRAVPGLESSCLLAVTGYGRDDDRRRSAEAGFDHHLVKPLDLDLLESLLADPRPSRSSPKAADPIRGRDGFGREDRHS